MKKNGSDRRPAFSFYTRDWMGDLNLRMCSPAARGLWIDLICIMHECDPYGHLMLNQKVIPMVNLSTMTGIKEDDLLSLINELESNKVIKKNGDGIYFSKRMVKDEDLRILRKNAGKRGGNPNLLNQEDNQKDKQEVKGEVKLIAEDENENEDEIEKESRKGSRLKSTENASRSKMPLAEKIFVDRWNTLGKPFSKIQDFTKSRKQHFKERMKNKLWKERWRQAMEIMKLSMFCRGETENGNWVAGVDFFLKPDSVTNILEGKYANDKRTFDVALSKVNAMITLEDNTLDGPPPQTPTIDDYTAMAQPKSMDKISHEEIKREETNLSGF